MEDVCGGLSESVDLQFFLSAYVALSEELKDISPLISL